VCGRFNVASTPGLQALLDSLGSALQLPPPRFNVAPTETISLLRQTVEDVEGVEEDFELTDARWWLTPHWAKELSQKYSMFNARSETLDKSPAFRKPFASQRGIVPVSAFLEWRGEPGSKQPWLITNESEALAIAALWDVWFGGDEPLLSCTLVTTAAAESFRPWHSRMPVLLAPEDRERWLDNSRKIASDDPLFAPRLREGLRLVPVAKAAGNSRNKDARLMAAEGEWVTLGPTR
jgi:putative SOS response-associated peptidase YedK